MKHFLITLGLLLLALLMMFIPYFYAYGIATNKPSRWIFSYLFTPDAVFIYILLRKYFVEDKE